MYVNVSLPIASFKSFTYRVPKELSAYIKEGVCVVVPFGKRKLSGYVVDSDINSSYKGKILSILEIDRESPHISSELWKTILWTSRYYFSPLGQALKCALPISFKGNKPSIEKVLYITALGHEKVERGEVKGIKQLEILNLISANKGRIQYTKLKDIASSISSITKTLESKQLIEIKNEKKLLQRFFSINKNIVLTKQQTTVYKEIEQNFTSTNQPCLLYGITGSGKTEVYLKYAQSVLESGKNVLILVPEISLTTQLKERIEMYFGKCVGLWHSKVTAAKKRELWDSIKAGDVRIILGARSAIFTPMKGLGLIVVDEEQESSYKQSQVLPLYHARDVAIQRSKNAGVPIILASATPSLESYQQTVTNKFKYVELSERYGGSKLPLIEMVDMKAEMKNNGAIISQSLEKAIESTVKKGQQVILLHNRRGFSRVKTCLDCGHIEECAQCSAPRTYHQTTDMLHCHHCLDKISIDSFCHECKGVNIRFQGAGTQKIESQLSSSMPNIKIIRLDRDAASTGTKLKQKLKEFQDRKADILIGTQMIAKGLDFENVTLVGVVNADLGLFLPDFRSNEKTFQLIYQVIGRAGRRKVQGKAVIQTYNIEDIYIQLASSLDLKKYYAIALSTRQDLYYPPFSNLIRLLFTGKDIKNIHFLADVISKKISQIKGAHVYGPISAPFERLHGKHRIHIVMKCDPKLIGGIKSKLFHLIDTDVLESSTMGVRLSVDIDPMNLL